MVYKRIAIIGISASGKTTLAHKIAKITKLPITFMDQLFFTGNWQEVPKEIYLAKHKDLVAKDEWIIEGYIDRDMQERIQRADLILYLDYSAGLCTFRLLKRYWQYRNKSRAELPTEAIDRFSWSFIKTVFFQKERPIIESVLASTNINKLIRCKNPKQCQKKLKILFPDF